MTNPVPQFPGKPAQTGPKTEPWQHAICPFLTAGELARQGPPSSLVQLGEKKQQVTAQACIGPKCMLFAAFKMQSGEVLAGCAPVHLMNGQMALNQMVAQFIEAAKAGAAAEAEEARREAEAQAAANAPPTPAPAAPAATTPEPTSPEPTPPSPLTAAADKAEAPNAQ